MRTAALVWAATALATWTWAAEAPADAESPATQAVSTQPAVSRPVKAQATSCPAAAAPAATSEAAAKELSFPWAGVAVSIPARFQRQTPAERFSVLLATSSEGQHPETVTLRAYPMVPGQDENQLLDLLIEGTGENPAVTGMRKLSAMPMPMGGLPGSARLYSYSLEGKPFVATQLAVVRQLTAASTPATAATQASQPDETLHLGYLLTVEVPAVASKTLLPVLDRTADSVRFIDLREPAETPIVNLEAPVPDKRLGYSIRPPDGWFAQFTRDGIAMGQTNYINEEQWPNLQIVVRQANRLTTPREVVEAVQRAQGEVLQKQRGLAGENISSGPASMGGLSGYQAVVLYRPRPGGKSAPQVAVIRAACAQAGTQEGFRAYCLLLTWPGADAKAAIKVTDLLAMGFELLSPPPASAPSTAPATAPATGPKAAPAEPITAPTTAPASTAVPYKP